MEIHNGFLLECVAGFHFIVVSMDLLWRFSRIFYFIKIYLKYNASFWLPHWLFQAFLLRFINRFLLEVQKFEVNFTDILSDIPPGIPSGVPTEILLMHAYGFTLEILLKILLKFLNLSEIQKFFLELLQAHMLMFTIRDYSYRLYRDFFSSSKTRDTTYFFQKFASHTLSDEQVVE